MDRAVPEDVREHERTQRGEDEQGQDLPAERVVLLDRLLRTARGDPDPSKPEHDRADARRGVALHERGDRDRVAGPGRGRRHSEHVAPQVCREAPAGAGRDEADAGEREDGGDPEPARELLESKRKPDQRGDDRRRAQEQRKRGRGRRVNGVDERELIEPDHDRGHAEQREVGPRDSQRSLGHEDDPDEDQRGRAVADRRVRERLEAVRQDVLRDGDVERPEDDRREQHQLEARRPAHGRDTTGAPGLTNSLTWSGQVARPSQTKSTIIRRNCAASRATSSDQVDQRFRTRHESATNPSRARHVVANGCCRPIH